MADAVGDDAWETSPWSGEWVAIIDMTEKIGVCSSGIEAYAGLRA